MRVFEFDRTGDPPRTLVLDRNAIDSEYTLESWLHANPEVILDEPLVIFGRQYGLDTGIPDLLALDQWGNVVVVELKKGESGSGSASEETILSQPQNYAQSLSGREYEDLEAIYGEYTANIRDGEWGIDDAAIIAESLIEAHERAFGDGIDRSGFNEYQRMIILAEDITSRTESNARYLLEQGLNVQCVEVQWFQFPEDAPVEGNSSILVSSTVVDYPLSRVRPERSSADYSNLTNAIRDQVAVRVRDREGIEEVRATPTQVRIESAYPPGLRYEVFIPGKKGGREAEIRMNAKDVADENVEAVRSLLIDYLDEQEPFEVHDKHVLNMVYREEPVAIGAREVDTIEEIAAEAVFLVEYFQPHLVEEFNRTG